MDVQQCKQFIRDQLLDSALDPTRMKRSALALLGALPIAMNAMVSSAGKNIAIVYGAHELGATDGKTVRLINPPIPKNDADVDTFALLAALMYGLGHHEFGHVNHSCFKVVRKPMTVLVRHVFGIIEDVRMENEHIRVWPGSRRFLDALAASLQVTGHYSPVNANEAPIRVFTGYLLYRLYEEYRQDPTVSLLSKGAQEACEAVFSANFTARLNAVLPEMKDVKTTSDALNFAKRLVKFLENEQSKAKQDAKDQSGQPDQSDQNQGAQQQQGASGGQQQGQQGSSNAGQQGPSPADIADRLNDVLSGQSADAAMGDKDQLIAQAVTNLAGKIEGQGKGGTIQMDESAAVTPLDLLPNPKLIHGAHDLNGALMVTAMLRNRLRKELETATITESSIAVRGRRISGKHLPRVPTGDHRVFKTDGDEVGLDTAVALATDVSSSMVGSKIKLASEALFASCVALESIDDVDVVATTFPGNAMVKPFGVKARFCPERFHLMSSGSTPMASGVTLSTRLLQSSRKSRKVMFVITDGEPNSHSETAVAIRAAEASGIEVYGIGIQHEVDHLFDRHAYLENIGDLPQQIVDMFRQGVVMRLAA